MAKKFGKKMEKAILEALSVANFQANYEASRANHPSNTPWDEPDADIIGDLRRAKAARPENPVTFSTPQQPIAVGYGDLYLHDAAADALHVDNYNEERSFEDDCDLDEIYATQNGGYAEESEETPEPRSPFAVVADWLRGNAERAQPTFADTNDAKRLTSEYEVGGFEPRVFLTLGGKTQELPVYLDRTESARRAYADFGSANLWAEGEEASNAAFEAQEKPERTEWTNLGTGEKEYTEGKEASAGRYERGAATFGKPLYSEGNAANVPKNHFQSIVDEAKLLKATPKERIEPKDSEIWTSFTRAMWSGQEVLVLHAYAWLDGKRIALDPMRFSYDVACKLQSNLGEELDAMAERIYDRE